MTENDNTDPQKMKIQLKNYKRISKESRTIGQEAIIKDIVKNKLTELEERRKRNSYKTFQTEPSLLYFRQRSMRDQHLGQCALQEGGSREKDYLQN